MKLKLLIGMIVLAITSGGVFLVLRSRQNNSSVNSAPKSKSQTAEPSYTLNLDQNQYLPNTPIQLRVAIQDQENKNVTRFKGTSITPVHVISIKKDGSNFQHLLAAINRSTGMVEVSELQFDQPGAYRIFAEFSPENGTKDDFGNDKIYAPYQDIEVGSAADASVALKAEKLNDTANGINVNLSVMEGDGVGNDLVGTSLNLSVRYKTGETPFTQLEPYLGKLGHMVVLDSNLNYLQADVVTDEMLPQSGLVVYQATFPKAGQYQLYVMSKAQNTFNTNSFVMDVK